MAEAAVNGINWIEMGEPGVRLEDAQTGDNS